MADTAVALASGNVKLVSSKVVTFPLPSGLWFDVSVCFVFISGGFLFYNSHFKKKFFVIKLSSSPFFFFFCFFTGYWKDVQNN